MVQPVVHVADDKPNAGVVQAYASVLAQMQNREPSTLVLANSSLATPVAARVSVKLEQVWLRTWLNFPMETHSEARYLYR